ncbi:LTXXQ domain protein [Pseudomonas sp.]|jgi:protein CpxP|uniref:LTXXQ domain protein n=1 Tax=Pseudomonas sp. TaxID=306 RepID=UPI0037CA647D
MRKTLTAVLLALTLPTLAMAMPDGGPRHGGEHRGEHGSRMFKELDLSKEQHREIRKLMGGEMKSRHEITQRYLDKLSASDKQAMQAEIKTAQDKQQSAIRALLKPEQHKAFDEQLKKMQDRQTEMAEFKAWKAEKTQQAN